MVFHNNDVRTESNGESLRIEEWMDNSEQPANVPKCMHTGVQLMMMNSYFSVMRLNVTRNYS